MDNETVLSKIEQLYHSRGWTTYRLSKISGIRQSTLSSIFSKRSTISLDNLDKICNALEVKLSEFFAMLEREKDQAKKGSFSLDISEEFISLSAYNRRLLETLFRAMRELEQDEKP